MKFTETPDLMALLAGNEKAAEQTSPARTDDGRYRNPILEPGYRKGQSPPNKGKTYPAEPLTPGEVLRLIAECPTGKIGDRNRALIVVLWRSGLRISEALALLPHHIDYQACTVTVLKGKGGKRRTSGIDRGALDLLQPWLERREKLDLPAGSPLFCTASKPNPGRPLFSAYVRELLHELGEKAGIEKRVHPHGLRHTLACDLVREGVPVHLVQRQLGHSNLGTTATYLQGIAPFEVIDVISMRSLPQTGQVAYTHPAGPAEYDVIAGIAVQNGAMRGSDEEIAPGVLRAPLVERAS